MFVGVKIVLYLVVFCKIFVYDDDCVFVDENKEKYEFLELEEDDVISDVYVYVYVKERDFD